MRRSRLPIGHILAALCVSPVAISWACNPQAQLFTDKAAYFPGETMVLLGSFFPSNTGIAITRTGGVQTTVTTGPNGSLEASLPAPPAPGLYTVTATRADGGAQSGLPKVTSFEVRSYPTPRQPSSPVSGSPNGNFATDPTMRCGGVAVTLVGTSGYDVIRGTRRRDVIAGLEGDDVIRGVGGGDLLCGGAGRDRLTGGGGADRLAGNGGADRLRGGSGADRLDGGAGTDRCRGDGGRDRIARCEISRR